MLTYPRAYFGLHHTQSHAEGGIEYVVLCAGGASTRTRGAARRDDASGSADYAADHLRQSACDRAALLRLQDQLGVLRGDLATQEASRRELEETSRRQIDELTRRMGLDAHGAMVAPSTPAAPLVFEATHVDKSEYS